jgi:hypothetical protein
MSYRHIGSAYGRQVFVTDTPEPDDPVYPVGYSIAAVVLKAGWKSDELGSLLNQLYGGIDDWTAFTRDAGARSFVFFGERAEEASDLCDAFAYAWTKGAEEEYNDVIASSNDAPDLDSFVETVFSGEISVGDSYVDKLQNTIFGIVASDPMQEADYELIRRVTGAVESAVQRHHFD